MGLSRFLDAGCSFIRAFVLLLAIGLPFAAQSQSIAVRDLAVLVDADGSETIASVSAPEAAQRFRSLDGLFSAGYTRKVHWLRFSVQAPAAGSWWLEVMPPFLDDLRLFTPETAGFAERRAGDRLPFAVCRLPFARGVTGFGSMWSRIKQRQRACLCLPEPWRKGRSEKSSWNI